MQNRLRSGTTKTAGVPRACGRRRRRVLDSDPIPWECELDRIVSIVSRKMADRRLDAHCGHQKKPRLVARKQSIAPGQVRLSWHGSPGRPARRGSSDVARFRIRPDGAATKQPRATPWETMNETNSLSPEWARQGQPCYLNIRCGNGLQARVTGPSLARRAGVIAGTRPTRVTQTGARLNHAAFVLDVSRSGSRACTTNEETRSCPRAVPIRRMPV